MKNNYLIQNRINFINEYKNGDNAATSSKVDPNANVDTKNIATLSNEIGKFENILTNRTLISEKISLMFGQELADEYIRQIEEHEIYVHDETSLMPYCVSVNMYPYLKHGLTTIGGESTAPTNLNSFCGSFVNLIFAIASQFAGAVATVEFLMYFDYFAKKEFGDDYFLKFETIIFKTPTKELTILDYIKQYFQQVVYSINQPAAARGYQSVFWNISIFDKNYFESMFGHFYFPDQTQPQWESLSWLQETFLTWFNEERKRAVLSFPVVTVALLSDDEQIKDQLTANMICEQLANGNSFFMYLSKNADSLASCCRLRNEISENTFSYSLGAGGVSTGSINVITMNVNRLIQKNIDIKTQVDKIHKYHLAFRKIVEEYYEAGLLPIYTAGFISLDKQFCTIGINGLVEAAEYKGIDINVNDDYFNFIDEILQPIYEANKQIKKETGVMFNTEFVPAENLGVKNSTWDREDNFIVNRDTYNSYFYIVEDDTINTIDKFYLHGERATKYLDGGSALHLNLDEHLSQKQYMNMLNTAVASGCNYFTINVKNTICNDCGNIAKETFNTCPKCSSTNVDFATRVIGYLKRISSFSKPRQNEAKIRNYHKNV